MQLIESVHWKIKKQFKQDIEDYMIEFAVMNCKRIERDKYYKNALNAIALIPQTGRRLKVVFRRIGKDKVKIITAYYLD